MKPTRIHRLLRLITLLQSGTHYLADDMARILEVSRRTLFRDLNTLKQAGIPLRYDPAHHTHRIEREFFLPPVNLGLREVLALMLLVQEYAVKVNMPDPEAAQSALTKIQTTLPAELQEYCGNALDSIEVHPAPLSEMDGSANTFELLWRAAQDHEVVRIRYESYNEQRDIETELRPYRLVFIRRGWYVIGFSRRHDEIRTFKIERILSTHPLAEHFKPDPNFNTRAYFGNAWQMIRGDQRYHVRIRFSAKVAGNVEEILWHHTQQIQHCDDGAILYEVDVDGLNEIAWWIMGYGSEAVIEEPTELRTIIARHVQRLAATYRDLMT